MWCCSNFCTIQSKSSIMSRCQSLTCRLSAVTWSDVVKPLSITTPRSHAETTLQKSWKHRMHRPMWHLHVTVSVYAIASIQSVNLIPQPSTGALPLNHTGVPAPLAAFSGDESLCFSLRLCSITTSAVRQTLRGPGTRGWMTMTKIWSRFAFTV